MRLFVFFFFFSLIGFGQSELKGKVTIAKKGEPVWGASVLVMGSSKGTLTNQNGEFKLLWSDNLKIKISAVGMKTIVKSIGANIEINIELEENISQIEEVVITGTMKELSKSDSPVPIEIISPAFLAKNPTSSIFDALQNVNGVRPQINCNVCNTGDIHINGLEGPYTMVLIDGMPIVSSLGSVYGLSGIPNSLVERIELVKGPASTLYGSEAVGGLLNIITKTAIKTAKFSFDTFGTSWGETNFDLGAKVKLGQLKGIIGVNYFRYNNLIDKNSDNFTDLTLQNRVSIFNKFEYGKKNKGSVAFRLFYENRWGGDIRWEKIYRGTDIYYGESIYTKRAELIGKQKLGKSLSFQYSFNAHDQNSYYGTTFYKANQNIAFGQFLYQKSLNKHELLIGLPLRFTFYDDNTPATEIFDKNQPQKTLLPGLFAQDDWKVNDSWRILSGMRVDYNTTHGWIASPRLAVKYNSNLNLDVLRLNIGRGYRVVNIFTEEHAALTGARKVEIIGKLKPEESWNVNLNYVRKIILNSGFIGVDLSTFYTYFSNKIIPNYNLDPNKIIYQNTTGFVSSKGLSANLEFSHAIGLKINAGVTFLDVNIIDGNTKVRPLLTEKTMGTLLASFPLYKDKLSVDYTSNFTGSMKLPTLGENDPRPIDSPFFWIHNIQFTHKIKENVEVYGGIKNILNFVPYRNLPFLIARPEDPFDKKVVFDDKGNVLATSQNPYALSFDPNYVYTSMQGRRGFFGVRWHLN